MKRVTKEKCPECSKEFILSIETIPSKIDEKHKVQYYCPYCSAIVGSVLLAKNEVDHVYKSEK